MTFNVYEYFDKLTKQNLLCRKNNFVFKSVTGLQGLHEVLTDMKQHSNFIAVDDYSDGKVRNTPTGPFTKYVYNVYIFARFSSKKGGQEERNEKLELCRKIRSQLISRLLKDKEEIPELEYVYLDEVVFREFKNVVLNNSTGTYFFVNIDQPENLCYNEGEWTK